MATRAVRQRRAGHHRGQHGDLPGYLKRIEIHGSDGSAVMEEEDLVKWDFAKKKPRDAAIHRRWPSAKAAAAGRPIRRPSAITATPGSSATCSRRSARAPPRRSTAAKGRRSVEIILAIYKAAETGSAVTLPLAGDPVLKARKAGVGAREVKSRISDLRSQISDLRSQNQDPNSKLQTPNPKSTNVRSLSSRVDHPGGRPGLLGGNPVGGPSPRRDLSRIGLAQSGLRH